MRPNSDPRYHATQRSTRPLLRATAVVVACGLLGAGMYKYGGQYTVGDTDDTSRPANGVPKSPRKQASRSATDKNDTGKYEASFNKLAARLDGKVGLAWAPVGRTGDVQSLGNFKTGPAWSTIKVPIAVAAADSPRINDSPAVRQELKQAITQSDNAAAKKLWERLGSPEEAADATEAVLRAAGDMDTSVQSRVTRRSQFSPYGQTKWSLVNQARFAAELPCLSEADTVLELMGSVTSSQQWGAGAAGMPAAIKGGWGPDADGNYLVRQMAIIDLPNKEHMAVAMAAAPEDGTFKSGTDSLTKIAKWAVENIDGTGDATC